MEFSLETKNLTKHFESFSLEKVSIQLPKGSIMGLIGENGSGKTTLLNTLLGVSKYDEGEIYVHGKNINENNTAAKELIGFVPDANFFPDSLQPNQIGKIMKGVYGGWNEKLFESYLDRFAIPKTMGIKKLSLGMKKKLLIAVSLSHQAKILLLDEVMNGLDPVARSDIRDILMEFIQDEECSILISSHIMEDLEKICDYITLIHNGKVAVSRNKDILLEEYGILKCSKKDFEGVDEKDYISCRHNAFGFEALVADRFGTKKKYGHLLVDEVGLEDIMVFLARSERR